MKLEVGKSYRTFIGSKVRIVDCNPDVGCQSTGLFSYVGWIIKEHENSTDTVSTWKENGESSYGRPSDIVSEWKESKARLLAYRNAIFGEIRLIKADESIEKFLWVRVPHLDEPEGNE